jgi:hypothetical protein
MSNDPFGDFLSGALGEGDMINNMPLEKIKQAAIESGEELSKAGAIFRAWESAMLETESVALPAWMMWFTEKMVKEDTGLFNRLKNEMPETRYRFIAEFAVRVYLYIVKKAKNITVELEDGIMGITQDLAMDIAFRELASWRDEPEYWEELGKNEQAIARYSAAFVYENGIKNVVGHGDNIGKSYFIEYMLAAIKGFVKIEKFIEDQINSEGGDEYFEFE